MVMMIDEEEEEEEEEEEDDDDDDGDDDDMHFLLLANPCAYMGTWPIYGGAFGSEMQLDRNLHLIGSHCMLFVRELYAIRSCLYGIRSYTPFYRTGHSVVVHIRVMSKKKEKEQPRICASQIPTT